jgi:hypothetical protein
MVYHILEPEDRSPILEDYPQRSRIQPIIFLSRLLNAAEQRYWPIELEIAGIVWVLRKVRHLVESSKAIVRVYTDYGAALGISKQSTLETTSTKCSNLRLIRASEYIQRFDISIRYKPGKTNVVPNALSRLKSATKVEEDAELDFESGYISIAYNFIATMAEMSPEFKERLIQRYAIDPAF